MSGPDEVDQDKSFLARWSQRKQQAKQPESKPDMPVAGDEVPPGTIVEADAGPELDLSSLPKLEELTETTDMAAFLRKGVPEHLRNAALRKSWALDPAIRNYVNPALEYAYDWNTPGGVPGNGEIEAGMNVARLVSQIMDGDAPAEPSNSGSDPAISVEHAQASSADPDLPEEALHELPFHSLRLQEPSLSSESGDGHGDQIVTTNSIDSVAPQQPVRRHGSAKPIV
jgi:hypothetical protein